MAHWVIECAVDADTPQKLLPPRVPTLIWGYAKAFLLIERSTIRFFWRSGKEWLDVMFVRESNAGMSSDRTRVRVAQVDMPRGITARELDVLTLVALGHTNNGISERLGTSPRTVSSQLERLFEKLDQNSRGGLAAVAVDLGLLRLPIPGGIPDIGDIAIAKLELAYQHGRDLSHQPIRMDVPGRTPIRLGVVVPEGIGADPNQMVNGALLAIDEINQAGGLGGRRVEPVIEKVKMFDWSDVCTGLERLFMADVDAILTSYVSSEHPQFMDFIAAYGKPFLHTATFEADVTKTEAEPWRYGMVFQTCASETYYGPGMLRLITKLEAEGLWTPRTRKIVSIEMSSDSMHIATPEFHVLAEEQDWRVATNIKTSTGETDWDQVIVEAASHDPDVMLIANYIDQELIDFQNAFLRSPSEALVYCIYSPSIPSYVQVLGEKAEGVIWSTTTGTYDDDLGRKFRTRYRVKYGQDSGWSQAGAAYDQVRILAAAWSSVDSRNVEAVVEHLRRWPYRGVNGVYYFGESSQTPRLYPDTSVDAALSQAHMVFQIQNGEHALLQPEPFGEVSRFRLPHWFRASRQSTSPVTEPSPV